MTRSSPCSILIRFISNPTAPTWWGFLVAGLMFLCSMAQTLVLHQYFHCIFEMALRLRTAITGVIYRKVRWNRVGCGGGGRGGGGGEALEASLESTEEARRPSPSPRCRPPAGSGYHQFSQT